MDDDALLAEQQDYYRARAPEYDDWWQRRGRYGGTDAERTEWDRQVAELDAALADFGATGDVLELAGGTGWWTQRLAASASALTVVDGSPETLELNRQRLLRSDHGSDVRYVVADLFEWEPDRRYDVVFFSFWISHVPRPRFSQFWSLVRRSLAPDGRAFFIDNRDDPVATHRQDPYVREYLPDLHHRELGDGSRWRVVKVMYEPEELQDLVQAEGWRATIGSTGWFIHGSALPG